eukprot:Opistho-2@45664
MAEWTVMQYSFVVFVMVSNNSSSLPTQQPNTDKMADKVDTGAISGFDKSKLKKTSTQEKNTLPTKDSEYLCFDTLVCLLVKQIFIHLHTRFLISHCDTFNY